MKYHDKQPARKGDTFTVGTFGTCRIETIDTPAHTVSARNVCTGEVFELDSLSDADLIEREPLKTAFDIRREFKAVSTLTGGVKGGSVFTCTVTLPDGETVKGIGSTLEKAEDTAWHGVAITLRDLQTPATV